MAMKCGLASKPRFKNEVIKLIEHIETIEDAKELKQEFLRGLTIIKSKYSSKYSTDEFIEGLDEIIKSDDVQSIIFLSENGHLESVLSQDVYINKMKIEDPYNILATLDLTTSKTDNLDTTELEKEERKAANESFLAQYFPMASDARLAYELRFKYNIIHSFFFNDLDPEYPRMNLSNLEMDKSIKQFRKELFKYLDDYAIKHFSNYEAFLKLNESSKLAKFKNLLQKGEISLGATELIKIPIVDLLTDEALKIKLKMYMAYISLVHFDEMIQNSFDDSVKIIYKGNYNTSEIKYRINLGNRAATTWDDDTKDKDETEQIGGVIRLYMESLNMYSLDGKMLPIKMTFSDVKSGFGGILNLFNDQIEGKLSRNFIPDLALINLKELLERTGIKKFYGEKWDTIYKNIVEGKTLGEIIARTKLDPAFLMPLLFTILAKNVDVIFDKRYQEKQAVYSIWENLFNCLNLNSLINRTINSNGINLDAADLYSFINTLFVNIENIPVIEYRKNQDKKIEIIGLKLNTSNSRLNSMKYTWAAQYGVEIPLNFRSFTILDLKDKEDVVKVEIKGTDLILEISPRNGIVTTIRNKVSGKLLYASQLKFDLNLEEFFSEVFNKKIDSDFMYIYSSIGEDLSKLISIAGHILYNYKVGKTIFEKHGEGITKELYDLSLESFYGQGNTPTTMRGKFQPELILNNIYPLVRKFSLALDIQSGHSGDTVARDGSRKLIALKGLSCLASKCMELFYLHNIGDPESILLDFNLYDTLENVEFMRDYAGIEAKKQATKFSISELFYANFLYDFYEGQIVVNEDGTKRKLSRNLTSKKPTKFRVMGPVISDKNKLAKLRFDWMSEVTLPDGLKKAYFELTSDDIYSIQQKEFGQLYEAMYQRIISDTNLLNEIFFSKDYLNKHKHDHKTSIIWAHPAIGKTKSIIDGEAKEYLIDFDVEFNLLRDLFISLDSGVRIEDPLFKKVRNDYQINPRKHDKYLLFVKERWEAAKQKAKDENKILVASPHILLELFPEDFDAIINIDTDTFIKRNVERGANSKENSILWKLDIEKTINGLSNKHKHKIFTTSKFLEEILFPNSTLIDFNDDYEAINMYAKLRGLDVSDVIHDIILLSLKESRRIGETDDKLKITEGLHYVKGRDGLIHNNPSLFHLLNIYGIRHGYYRIRTNNKYLPKLNVNTINETPELARERLNFQIVTDLLHHNIRLSLGDKSKTTIVDDAQLSALWLIEDGVWRKGNTVIYAKLKSDTEETVNLKNINDFKKWKRYLELVEFYDGKVPELFDVSSPKFELGTTLKAINILYKHRAFYFEQAKELLILSYIKSGLGQSKDIYEIVRNYYRKKFPTWKEETVERKTKEKVESLSEEEIIRRKAIYQIELDIQKSVLDEIKGEKNNFYEDKRQYLLNNLEDTEDNKKVLARLNSIKSKLNPEIKLEINPELERYHSLNNWLGETYELATVGTFISHAGDNNATTIYNYEYGSFGQQVKRNVSQTATKHREVLQSLKGIRRKLRLMVVEDEKDSFITFKGDYDKKGIKVHDGACIYNGTMVDLDNNSLGADAMGTDKKPYLHAIIVSTGTAVSIKCAGFAITNSNIRLTNRLSMLNKKMNHTIKWSDTLRKFKYQEPYFNWTIGFDGNPINVGEWYILRNVYDPKTDKIETKYYKLYSPTIDENGNTSVKAIEVYDNGESGNVLEFLLTFGYVNGEFTGIRTSDGTDIDGKKIPDNADIRIKPIDSNWELWKIFGGEYSAHLGKDGKLTVINDNTSFLKVVHVMNHTGKVIDPKIPTYSLSNVIQILKESLIDVAPTKGSVKTGPTNINSMNVMDDENYEPTVVEVFTDDFGEQLDAEHTAEGGHVSLMTLVINALGARGYSRRDAEECYQALEQLAELCYEEAFDALKERDLTGNISAFKVVVANIMLKTLNNVSISDGNILSALAQGLRLFLRFENYDLLEGIFPISSPLIYAKLFSKLASALEKSSIRLKFDGGLLVLNPSNRIYQIINGKLSGEVSIKEVRSLQDEALKTENLILRASQIKMGSNYFVIDNYEGTFKPVLVDNIDDFNKIKKAIESGYIVIEAFFDELKVSTKGIVYSGNKLGRDLATYDAVVTRKGTNETFSFWEIDSIKHLFSWDEKNKRFIIPDNREATPLERYWNDYNLGQNVELELLQELKRYGINEISPNEMLYLLYDCYLKTLNAASKEGIGDTVIINGETVIIDKSKTKISGYEAILPMIYKTEFGLKDGDTVGEIENDKNFFIKRFLDNSKSKFYSRSGDNVSVDGSSFDIELKRTSGEHIYLVHPDKGKFIFGEPITFPTEVVGNVLYRVDTHGNRLYQIPSKEENGKLVQNCRILKLYNGVEVIETDDFLSILDLEDYNSISLGNLNETKAINVLLQLEQSSNKSAQAKIRHILSSINAKIKTNINGIESKNIRYKVIWDNKELANAYLNIKDKNFKSISEIYSDEAAINALENSDIYEIDALKLQEELDELREILDSGNEKRLNEFLSENNYYKYIVNYGREQHTSFLTSLEAIVSRTPAQSHQSFMAMKVAGFDSKLTNSIYVSRMLLFLQGSDFDIDKANFLGLKFNNGKLVIWSNYFDLSSIRRALDSENLPFPTNKVLQINDNTTSIPFDVLEKDYQKFETQDGFGIRDNNGNVILAHLEGEDIYRLETLIDPENTEHSKLNTYLLLHAILHNLKGKKIIPGDSVNLEVFNITKSGNYKGIKDVNADIRLYLESLDLRQDNNKFLNLIDLGNLIRTFNLLGEIPSEFIDVKNIIDKHNKFFLGKDGKRDKRKDALRRKALYNFISIKTKNISKDPINLMLGLSGIDVATEEIKKLVKPDGKYNRLSSIPATSDNRSVVSRMQLLILTLTGKECVGIVASAMKVFEAMSHYYNKILSHGTPELLKRLLSNVSIMGKKLSLIANSFTKNEDTIHSNNVLKAYRNIDNHLDAFIMMSALLSLATDNAKDPTISKLNATPQTLGCYTAGLVLGLNIEDVAKLLVSDTGILLQEMVLDNAFNPKKTSFNKLSAAIKYLKNAPEVPEGINLDNALLMFGLIKELPTKSEKIDFNSMFWSKRKRSKLKQMAFFLLHPDEFKFEDDLNKLAKRELKDIKEDPDYWSWNKDSEELLANSTGKEKEELERRRDNHNTLVRLKESYEAYIENPQSQEAQEAARELKVLKSLIDKTKKDENINRLKSLVKNNESYKKFLETIFEWIGYREIIDNDKIKIGEEEYNILEQIRKLNSFNEEMGDLRAILKLNQGLPNSVLEQMSWINSFRGILRRAANRRNIKTKEDSNSPLSKFESKYNTLDLDLHEFLYNEEYRNDAINTYNSVKIGVNILDVMLGVPHYRGYMKTMDLLFEGGKAVSINYSTQSELSQKILPELSLKNPDQIDKFFKTLNPVIFERVNNDFLWLLQIEYEIPVFKIKDGKRIEQRDEKGNLLYEKVRLGTKEGNKKFAQYCVEYIYPYLKKNFPDNAFVKAISLRTYGYNIDHTISTNIAKSLSYDMTNPLENTLFNEVKRGLADLNSIRGLVTCLFYYNLIAYNGLPGELSLTDIFEDFIVYNTNETISEYFKYITYLDESGVLLFNMEENSDDIDYLLKVFSPTVFPGDNVEGMKYIWVLNPETNKEVLLKYVGKETDDPESGGYLDTEREQIAYELEQGEDTNYSKYAGYTTMSLILINWLNGEWIEFSLIDKNTTNKQKRFILGKETLANPDVIFDEFEKQKLESEKKTLLLSKLKEKLKNDFLKKHSEKIKLLVNGKTISLKDFVEQAKKNGWTEKDVYDGFVFVSRKSKDHSYDILVYSKLKHRIELILQPKNDC